MTKSNAPESMVRIFANRAGLAPKVASEVGLQIKARSSFVVVVSENQVQTSPDFNFPDREELKEVKRLLILFEGRPVSLEVMNGWRKWATDKMPQLFDLRMSFASERGDNEVVAAIRKECVDWCKDVPAKESPVGIRIARWVKMPDKAKEKDDPSLLTMMFGSMGELLTGLEVAARSFRDAVSKGSSDDVRKSYLKQIDTLLAKGGPGSDKKEAGAAKPSHGDAVPVIATGNVTDRIPKLLLLGETGVGKTLLARYLQLRCGFDKKPLHVSIPEFLGKEDMFEYKLFGYAAGNYTGGKPEGDHGLLLENVCRVVFLDEIGEANAELQAKLLTFLDHFEVRPRGWNKDPFYCPVMIVAATNRTDLLEKNTKGQQVFRNDLYRRFTDILPIPPLRDRKQDFEFILDCLLQRESMNPHAFVQEIGAEALSELKARDYKDGNFRELEDLFRKACRMAHRDDRPYLIREDFRK